MKTDRIREITKSLPVLIFALVWGAGKNNERMPELLLERGADVNAKDDAGWSALTRAARLGFNDVVKLLLDNGADAKTKDPKG